MHVADRLKHYLDDQHVACDLVPHPRTLTAMQSAHAAHVPSECMAKAVVVHHELGYLLAVVPSTHRVSLAPCRTCSTTSAAASAVSIGSGAGVMRFVISA